jgi:hypothetical protein
MRYLYHYCIQVEIPNGYQMRDGTVAVDKELSTNALVQTVKADIRRSLGIKENAVFVSFSLLGKQP